MLKKIILVSLFLVFLVNLSGNVLAAGRYFTFATPEITWATLKFAMDTKNFELFKKCFISTSSEAELSKKQFLKAASGDDGATIQCSRVVRKKLKGNEAVLYIDFFGRKKKGSKDHGNAWVDNDPVQIIKVSTKWLIKSI